jgi:hypothetical protein
MPDIVITPACIMPAGFGVGNHQMFVMDMQEETVLGIAPFRIKRFTFCRLNTKVSSGATQKNLQGVEEGLAHHQLIEKIGNLHMQYRSKKKIQRELNKLDQKSKDIMINLEWK